MLDTVYACYTDYGYTTMFHQYTDKYRMSSYCYWHDTNTVDHCTWYETLTIGITCIVAPILWHVTLLFRIHVPPIYTCTTHGYLLHRQHCYIGSPHKCTCMYGFTIFVI